MKALAMKGKNIEKRNPKKVIMNNFPETKKKMVTKRFCQANTKVTKAK